MYRYTYICTYKQPRTKGKPHRKCKMYFSSTIGIRISDNFQSLQRFLTEMIYLTENVEKNNYAFLTWHREPRLCVPLPPYRVTFTYRSSILFSSIVRYNRSIINVLDVSLTFLFDVLTPICRRALILFVALLLLLRPFSSTIVLLFPLYRIKKTKMISVYTPISLISVSPK